MITLTRRALLGACTVFSLGIPWLIAEPKDEIVIVNGWILKRSDLRDPAQ